MELIDQALELAVATRERAHCPYSGFAVGAAIKPEGGSRLYGGCNVENASYGATICAERAAVLSMISAQGKSRVEYVVVVTDADPLAVPCAACLQVLAEFSSPDTAVLLADPHGIRQEYRFDQLLPYPFVTF
ncbi:MAG: cytidine deaminase [Spirochaetota bacterium]